LGGRRWCAHPQKSPSRPGRETSVLLNAVIGASAEQIFGNVDAVKFRSCMTLFVAVAPEQTEFADALREFFNGAADEATLERI